MEIEESRCALAVPTLAKGATLPKLWRCGERNAMRQAHSLLGVWMLLAPAALAQPRQTAGPRQITEPQQTARPLQITEPRQITEPLKIDEPLQITESLQPAQPQPSPDATAPAAPPPEPSLPVTAPAAPISGIGRLPANLRRSQARHALYQDASDFYGAYSRFKQHVQQRTGVAWSVDLSYLPQWGWPEGGSAAGQFLSTASLEWKAIRGKRFGEGTVQISTIQASYPSVQSASQVADNMGVITPINDYPFAQDIFLQFTYTQAFPGDKLLLSVGQYSLFNFDANQYLFNQQVNFNSYIFSQNGSATYANAGLGVYGQLNLTSTLQVAAGLQGANNLSGATLSTRAFGEGGYAWFAYAQWSPQLHGLGPAQYSFLAYQMPSVPEQSASRGWSVNAVQNLNATWALFARANQAYGHLTPIRASYALGAAMNNPLGRSATDQIGLAIGTTIAAPPPANPAAARNETVLEAYWSWTLLGGVLLTPSVQMILDPALSPDRNSAWALSLRATLML